MAECSKRAVGAGAEAHGLPRRRAMADRAEHLLAPRHQLHRAADQARGHDPEHLRRPNHALGAEAAAEKGGADVDAARLDAEQPGDAALRHRHALTRRIQDQVVAVPFRHDGVRLHRVVVLGGRFVARLDPPLGRGEAGRHVAVPGIALLADADRGGHEPLARIQSDAGRLDGIGRAQQCRTLGRRLQGVADHHGDRLAGVADPVILQQIQLEGERFADIVGMAREPGRVAGRHHRDDPGMGAGGIDVHRGDASARDAADRHHRVQQTGRVVVGGVARGARDLEHTLAAGQRLADAGTMTHTNRGDPRYGPLRHGP